MPRIKTEAPVGALDTSKVPFRVTDEDYIPKERYTSQEFHDLEKEHIWRRYWQVAGREHDIPRPGDYIEYKIGNDAILVVRNKAGEVKAFVNACRHRGTQLGQGCGSYPTGKIVCPFHGWEYDLDGKCTYVFSREGFRPDLLDPEKIRLRPVQAAVKWGMLWVNMDLDAPSLEEYVADIAPHLDPLWMDKMRVRWWKTVNLKANWKTAQEAFFEGYHVMQSHPELTLFSQPDEVIMESQDRLGPRVFFKGGHWAHLNGIIGLLNEEGEMPDLSLNKVKSNIDILVAYNRAMWVGTQSVMTQRAYEITEELLAAGVPQDDNFPVILMEKVAADCAARNVPLPPPDPVATTWAHVFPNWTWLYGYGSILMYRSRPDGDDPNRCIYDFWSLEMVPDGTPVKRPEQATDEFFESMWLVHEDKGNIERMQVGLRSHGYDEHRLATTYEETISVFHRQMDQVLAERLAAK